MTLMKSLSNKWSTRNSFTNTYYNKNKNCIQIKDVVFILQVKRRKFTMYTKHNSDENKYSVGLFKKKCNENQWNGASNQMHLRNQ